MKRFHVRSYRATLFLTLLVFALTQSAIIGAHAAMTEPDLVLTMSAVPNPATSGTGSAFVITITNSGTDPADNVSVTDTLPATLPYVTCTTTVGTCSATGQAFSASLGTLAPSAVATINVWFSSPTVASPTSIGDTANVTTTTSESNTANNQASTTLIVNPLAGPPGAMVQAFAINPMNTSVIYAGTDGGGIFKTTDQGTTWTVARYGFANVYFSVRAILLDPATPSTVYTGTNFGVSKSTNSGQTWNVPVNNGLTNTNVFSLAMDPTNSSTFFSGTANGIFKSTNATDTWVSSSTGLNTGFPIDSIVIDSTNNQILYAASQGGGVYKSTDGGGTWTAANSGLTSQTVRSLVIDPSTPATIYAGTDSGVFKSTNSAGSWTAMNSGLSNTQVNMLAIDSSTTIYASTLGGGVFKTTNGASNWSGSNSGIANTQVRAVAIDPNHTTLYAGTGWGVWRSTNSGTNWSELNGGASTGISGLQITSLAIDPTNPVVLYAASGVGGGVFKTTDGGVTWARGSTLSISTYERALALDPTNPLTLYVADTRGVAKSTVASVNWNSINFGLFNNDARSIVIDPSNSSILYAGTAFGVFKTTNSGQTWNWITASGVNLTFAFTALAVDRTNGQIVYAGSLGSGIIKSTNGGNSWNVINTGLTNTTVTTLLIDKNNSSIIYAATAAGVFKSTDGGANWAPMVNGLTTQFGVNTLAQDPTNSLVLYAGTPSGTFKSIDGAATWTLASTGMTRPDTRAFAINPSNPSIIYAGTLGGGVFKSTDGAATWQPTGTTRVPMPAQLSVTVTQIPNPATAGGTLAFTVVGTNLGGTAADNVVLTFTVPSGVTFLSCNISCNNNNGVITASVGTVAAGASSTLIVTGSVGFTASQTTAVTIGGVSTTTTQVSLITNVAPLNVTVNPPAGPPTANVLTISPHPTDSNSYLAGTNGGGVFSSSDGGVNWFPSNAGLTAGTVRALVRVPGLPLTVFAGTNGGVFKGTGGGNTWTVMNSGLGNTNVFSLAIDPVTTSTFYAGTTGGIFKTLNSGGGWSPVNSGLNTTFFIAAIVINPSTPSTVYAATAGAGVFKSTNSGVTWSAVNTNLTSLDVEALAMDPSNSNILYAGTNGGGIFKTTDGASTWSAVNNGIPSPAGSLYQAVLINSNSSTLYAGASNQLIKSTDGGASWTSATSGLTTPYALSSMRIFSLVFDPSNSSTLLAGTGAGVFKSTNASSNWSASTTGLNAANVLAITVDPHNSAIVYAGASPDGWYKSIDAGKTWSVANSGLVNSATRVLAIDPSTSATVYIGGRGDGVYRSTNGGATWTVANTGMSTATVNALIIDPSNPATLFAGARTAGAAGGIFKTTNSGGSWTPMNNGLTNTDVRALVFDGMSTTTLYAGTFGGGVFKSTDGGASWNPLLIGLSNLNVQCLAWDTKHNRLYAGTNAGLFETSDGGSSWSQFSAGLGNTNVQALAIDPFSPSILYAATAGGLFISTNQAGNWFTPLTGFGNVSVTSVSVDPLNHEIVYAGLNGGGLFKSADAGMSWQPSGVALVPFPLPGTPVFISASAGSSQSALLSTNFATALQATVRDSTNSTVSGVAVTFSVPSSGPSGTFPGNQTSSVAMTNGLGIATAPTLTANALAGGYLATAGIGGSTPPANYTLSNIQAVSSSTFSIPDRGGMFASTAGLGSTSVGYATITPDNGKTTPAGFAITAFRANGTLISEFTIPAMPPISGGRMYVNTVGSIGTGFVVANRNAQTANISWSATDLSGTDAFTGNFNIGANSQAAVFLNQAPFNISNFEGTFTFTSNVPVAASGLRSLVNQRGEFILTSVPVFDMSAALTNSTAVVPFVPDGDGLIATIVLQNPTDTTISGTIQFADEDGMPVTLTANGQTLSTFNYSIPRRSTFKFVTSGTSAPMIEPAARIVPASGQSTPFVFEVASMSANGITVSEVGATATSGTALRTYLESSGSQSVQATLETVVGIANATANAGTVTIDFMDLAGNLLIPGSPMPIAGNGQFAFQVSDIFGAEVEFKGVARISSTVAITATTIRLHLNERGELLLSSIPVINEAAGAQSTPWIIPHFADGGGYSAQFVVFSGFANQSTSGQLQFFNQAGNPFNLDFNAKPSILAIFPGSALPGAVIQATISGLNLSGATAVAFSGTGVTATIIAGSGTPTSLSMAITVDPQAQLGVRTVTVTTAGGTSVAFTGFTVTTGKKRGGQVTSQ